MSIQANAAREYQLYQALQDARQRDRSIQDFYLLFSGYWEELQTIKVPISDSMFAFALEFQKQRERWNLFHFAM